jgi:large subunit ribosomal protein L2
VALRKLKPTSPGQRFIVRVVTEGLHKGDPYEGLLAPLPKRGGRNNMGRITTRHQGGGSKRYYRLVDFKRDKDGVAGRVVRFEYDPNRTSHLALVLYTDGERRYILAPRNLKVDDPIMSGVDAAIKPGNALPLKNIPLGTQVHCVELKPGKGAQLARSAGASVQIVAREGEYVTVRLRSGEMRKVHINCRATVGEVGNEEHNLRKIGNAGSQRHRGIRPTVRGVAMNPVDHPHGGGEGKSGQGNPHPVTPWGQKTKGYKTRRNKRTRSMIVRDRRQK